MSDKCCRVAPILSTARARISYKAGDFCLIKSEDSVEYFQLITSLQKVGVCGLRQCASPACWREIWTGVQFLSCEGTFQRRFSDEVFSRVTCFAKSTVQRINALEPMTGSGRGMVENPLFQKFVSSVVMCVILTFYQHPNAVTSAEGSSSWC